LTHIVTASNLNFSNEKPRTVGPGFCLQNED
jgi:hypothetical protein